MVVLDDEDRENEGDLISQLRHDTQRVHDKMDLKVLCVQWQ
jgi:3,4-dihydroxy-2-butanone 4-phosphate synthase